MFRVRSLTNAQESFKLVLILPIFHTFSVNSQNTFLSADFLCNKCLVLSQTCSPAIVDLYIWLILHTLHSANLYIVKSIRKFQKYVFFLVTDNIITSLKTELNSPTLSMSI